MSNNQDNSAIKDQKPLFNISPQSNIISGLTNIIIHNFSQLGQKSREILANSQKMKDNQVSLGVNSDKQSVIPQ